MGLRLNWARLVRQARSMISSESCGTPGQAGGLASSGTDPIGLGASSAGTAPNRRSMLGLPAAVEARLLALFGCLALIKLALVAGLTKHLHEVHWRVERLEPGWINYAVFFLFVGLSVANLWVLAGSCRKAGIRAVRGANLVVVVLGLLLAFLTFH